MNQSRVTPKPTRNTSSTKFLEDETDVKPADLSKLGLSPDEYQMATEVNDKIIKEKAIKAKEKKKEEVVKVEKSTKLKEAVAMVNAEAELDRMMSEEPDFTEDDTDKVFDKVASNLQEFNTQLRVAKLAGMESITVTDKVARYLNRTRYPKEGYFYYENVKCYVEGKQDGADEKDERRVNQVLGFE